MIVSDKKKKLKLDKKKYFNAKLPVGSRLTIL